MKKAIWMILAVGLVCGVLVAIMPQFGVKHALEAENIARRVAAVREGNPKQDGDAGLPVKADWEFDNTTSAETLRPAKTEEARVAFGVTENWGKSTDLSAESFAGYWEASGLSPDHVLLRYHMGQYYSVVKTDDGGYIFTLYHFMPKDGKSMIGRSDACYVTQLADADRFLKLRLEDNEDKVQTLDPDSFVSLKQSVHRLDNLVTVNLGYEDGVVSRIQVVPPRFSVLTYLLPQDLALIS